jgi:hypothetical protein
MEKRYALLEIILLLLLLGITNAYAQTPPEISVESKIRSISGFVKITENQSNKSIIGILEKFDDDKLQIKTASSKMIEINNKQIAGIEQLFLDVNFAYKYHLLGTFISEDDSTFTVQDLNERNILIHKYKVYDISLVTKKDCNNCNDSIDLESRIVTNNYISRFSLRRSTYPYIGVNMHNLNGTNIILGFKYFNYSLRTSFGIKNFDKSLSYEVSLLINSYQMGNCIASGTFNFGRTSTGREIEYNSSYYNKYLYISSGFNLEYYRINFELGFGTPISKPFFQSITDNPVLFYAKLGYNWRFD